MVTRPTDPAMDQALRRRWDALPAAAQTNAQLLGRLSLGCEGTHGVFPQCDFACAPCYHSADANKVRIDGGHTLTQIRAQMAFLRQERGPAAYAQLIGGEVTLLDPADHAAALEAMAAEGRIPMSFSHGDFDDEYLRAVVLQPGGTPRFGSVSWSLHIDSTMKGRTGAEKPATEAELHPFRVAAVARFERLRADHGISSYLAHTMTVTPGNLDEVADVVRRSVGLGFRMFSFQPAAYVGNETRWSSGFGDVDDDAVWAQIEAGVGRPLPHRMLQLGDHRCNRTCWGALVGGRFVPALEDDDDRDAAVRDLLFTAFRGNRMHVGRFGRAARMIRAVVEHPRVVTGGAAWARRFVRRAGGLRAFRGGVAPLTFVVHSFIDAEDVGPAWELLQRNETSEEPRIRAAQERLAACSYTMGHPESGELVPACVQHSVLDPPANRQLVELLPRRPRRLRGS